MSSPPPPHSRPSPATESKMMISPPNSDSNDTNISTGDFDSALLSREESKLTSASSILLTDQKSLEEKGQSQEPLFGKVAPEEGVQHGDKDEIMASTPDTPYPSVRQELVSLDTLRTYHIHHHIDPLDLECVVIERAVPEYEMEFLKRHTKELQKESVDQAREAVVEPPVGSEMPLDNLESESVHPEYRRGGRDTVVSPVRPAVRERSLSATRSDTEPDLLLQTNRIPFEKWLWPADESKRGKSVLDVAMWPKETSAKFSDPVRPSHSLSSGADEDACVPVRLAINSSLIQSQLQKITKCNYGRYGKVMHPPWKLLVTYHEDIKKCLHELEEKGPEEYTENLSKENVTPEQTPLVVDETQTSQTEPSTKTTKEKEEFNLSKPCEVCLSSYHSKRLECLGDTISHLKILVDFIDNDLKHVFELRQGLKDGTISKIAFQDLWHLYSPGQLLVTSGPRQERQVYKVFYTCGGRSLHRGPSFEKSAISSPFAIHCYCMELDKRWLGPVHQTITIQQFDGKRLVTELLMSYSNTRMTRTGYAFPVSFLDDRENAIAHIVRRGRRFRELIPFSHKRYCGPSTVEDPEYLNSEIIIDIERQEDNNSIGVFGSIQIDSDEIPDGCNIGEPCWGCTDVFNDNIIDSQLATQYKEDRHLLSKRTCYDENLTDEHFMLLPTCVDAFVLRERDTFSIYIDLVQDLDGDGGESLEVLKKKSGFQDLVLPEGHGDLVEALVRNHRSTRNSRDEDEKVQVDLIDGKGEGLIILLHGVPGVGKTSTAECVAAYTRRPLYPITCANIGLDPEEVEKNLTGPSGHFRTAQQWNCVVLLDEADVFLAKRETRDNDAKRNALVSVFLRTLEYYPGILILTTNRVGSFDEAVVSRIQLFLYYPPLDEEKTMKVWHVHINRVRSSLMINIDREDEIMIMEFAKEEYSKGRRWNGRQIRNFFQTAISLASYDATKWRQKDIEDGQLDKDSKPSKPRLTTRTLKIVVATSGKFIDYIATTLPDASYFDQQLSEGNRNDKWKADR